jgi:integrase
MPKKIAAGTVIQRRYKTRDGKFTKTLVWYAKYYDAGKRVCVPTGTEDRDEAIQFLRKKMAEVGTQRNLCESPERVRMGQLFDLVLNWYALKERRSTYDVKLMIEKKNGLRAWFGKMKAQAVSSSAIAGYIAWRRREKPRPTNGTINRELAYVRRAMKLGAAQDPPIVARVPRFDMLPEADPRQGVLGHKEYKTVRDALPAYARIVLVIGYNTGARKGEIVKILREHVDLAAGRIEIPARSAKNKRARFLPVYGQMGAEIEMAIAMGDPACPYLIQREGQRVYDFEKAWATACELAGVPDTLFHDLRRTALTNMIEAGFSEKEAMEISGHRTRSVFDRYHIVSERRMKEMAGRLDAHMKAKDTAAVPVIAKAAAPN